MKRLLGGFFETFHLVGSALLFAAAAALTFLTTPKLLALAGLSAESGGRIFDNLGSLVESRGAVVAGVALLAAVLAPYVRSDDKKGLAWARILCAGGSVVCVVWLWRATQGSIVNGDVEMAANTADALLRRADTEITPWNALGACAGLNLILAAFQVNGHSKD